MKKGMKIAACLAAVALLFAGCGKKEAKTLDAGAFVKQVMETVSYDDDMVELSENVLPDYYDLAFDGFVSAVVYVSGSGATSNELAVIEVEDSNALSDAKEAVDKRRADLTANYQDYIPAEMARIEKAIVVEEGNYLLFSISESNESIEKLFRDSLK